MSATPRVSVIVPVRNRRDLLADLLAALDQQTFSDFEVVVIDDGSTDGADDVAEKAMVAGKPVRVLRAGGRGAVAARLIGIEASQGSILAFTDSDCAPEPGWLEAGVRAIDAGAAMANGLTRPARRTQPLERSLASGEEGLYPTCNMFYRRDAYDAAGGFDAEEGASLGFRPDRNARGLGFCEDTMLAWRVRRAQPWAYASDAVVAHHVFPVDVGESVRRAAMVGAFPTVLRAIPELRTTLMRGPVLFRQYTRLPIYALLASMLLRRRRPAAASAAAWMVLQLREFRTTTGAPWPRCAKALVPKFVIDVVSAASLLAGSVRARFLAV